MVLGYRNTSMDYVWTTASAEKFKQYKNILECKLDADVQYWHQLFTQLILWYSD